MGLQDGRLAGVQSHREISRSVVALGGAALEGQHRQDDGERRACMRKSQ